jgi:hypothetical protein
MRSGANNPIFTTSDVGSAELRKAIADCGCFVLRRLFDPGALARIHERTDFVGRAWDYIIVHGYTTDIQAYVDKPFKDGHLPETHIDVAATWDDLTAGSPFDRITEEVFGATARDYALRRITPQQKPLSFHQDALFIGADPWYNFWTPLQNCGVDAPGLEVVIGSGVPAVGNGEIDSQRMAAYVERTYGLQSYWTPIVEAGDALVFTSMLFHRTELLPGATKTRFSLELRDAITARTRHCKCSCRLGPDRTWRRSSGLNSGRPSEQL